uniref:ABC transporter domain-containing protein n=1 Tax=Heterorhabditis bacteriophora TaxID=37862 RepID=A0A1I7WZK4_HETBA
MYKFRKKQVLNSVFGAAHPGKVLAIMGASGAGKTSLLNILAQRNTGALEVRGSMKTSPSDRIHHLGERLTCRQNVHEEILGLRPAG